jgi:alpha-L-rhamnosidase
LEQKLRDTFWNKKVEGEINRQTLFSALLYHKIIPKDEIKAAKDSLMDALQKAPAQHLTTGIFGTPFALEAISQFISPQTTFDMINSKDYPGWGYMVDRGATTLWETWQESDDIYSNSHPMFGSVTEWFYRWLGGIRPNPDYPGFERFYIKPFTPVGLDSVSTSYRAPAGKIISSWVTDNGGYRYQITVPKSCIAEVVLNKTSHQRIIILKGKEHLNTSEIDDLKDGKFILKSGKYAFSIPP